MASTTAKSKTGGFQAALSEARNLRGQAGIAAHRRANLLVGVFADLDYRMMIGVVDDDAVARSLDAECEDLCLSFFELQQTLREFPDQADWADGRLRTLFQRAMDRGRSASRVVRTLPPRTEAVRRSVTIREYDRMSDRAVTAEERVRWLENENSRLLAEVDQLRAEVARLLELNTKLRRKRAECLATLRAWHP